VTYAPGAHGTFTPQTTYGLAYGAATPAPPVAVGEQGWLFIGWSPAPAAVVTGNATYTALWSESGPREFTVTFVDWDNRVISVQTVPYGGSAVAPADPTRQGYTFVGWDRPFTNVTANITVRALYEAERVVNIDIKLPPLTGNNGTWALINLVLTVIGIVLSLAMLVTYFYKRKDEDEYDDEFAINGNTATRSKRLGVRLVNILCAAVAVVLFLITQNLSQRMVLVDWWTIVHVVILIAQTILIFFSSGYKVIEDEDEGEAALEA
jgi:hypothetical protein